ncbi:MAG: L-serine ammonia-lyase [Bacteroidales bacterium]
MKSICGIYKIGNGPSSSHTMGPMRAATIFKKKHPQAARFEVNLYGSLAATGEGHLTNQTLLNTLAPIPTELLKFPTIFLPYHPNGMIFEAFDGEGQSLDKWEVYSIGGGDIREKDSLNNIADEDMPNVNDDLYAEKNMDEVLDWCITNGRMIWEYVAVHEEPSCWEYLHEVWQVMKEGVERGINAEGVLPGSLNLQRKAAQYAIKAQGYRASLKSRSLTFAYALATAEENAAGGRIVTAPTCGSAGVLPAILYHTSMSYGYTDDRIVKGLATAAIFANVVKKNASISGAEVGCQGEIGVACAMAAAACNQIFGGSISQIEYAAEMGLEHHLGLTCDPMCGLVQIPCIERCAFAATRAFDANLYSMLSDGRHRVSFDRVVQVMKQTGHDLPSLYKETSLGGLATVGLKR